jgi:hypothetical protein
LLRTIRFDFGPDPDDVLFLLLLFFLVGTSVLEFIPTAQLLFTGWQSGEETFQFTTAPHLSPGKSWAR